MLFRKKKIEKKFVHCDYKISKFASMKKKQKPREEPTSVDIFLRRYLILFILIFSILFDVLIEPFLYNLFFVDHKNDCLNVWGKDDTFDIKLFFANCSDAKFGILLKNLSNVPYKPSSPVFGDLIISLNFKLPLLKELLENKANYYFTVIASLSKCNFINKPPKCYGLSASIPVIKSEKTENGNKTYYIPKLAFDIIYDTRIHNRDYLSEWTAKYATLYTSGNFYVPPIVEDEFWKIDSQKQFLELPTNNSEFFRVNIKVNIRYPWLWETKLSLDSTFLPICKKTWEKFKGLIINIDPRKLFVPNYISAFILFVNLFLNIMELIWCRKTKKNVSLSSICISLIASLIIFTFFMNGNTPWGVKFSVLIELFVASFKFHINFTNFAPNAKFDVHGFICSFILISLIVSSIVVYDFVFKQVVINELYLINIAEITVYLFYSFESLPQFYLNWKLHSAEGINGGRIVLKSGIGLILNFLSYLINIPSLYVLSFFSYPILLFLYIYQDNFYSNVTSTVNDKDVSAYNKEIESNSDDKDVTNSTEAGEKEATKKEKNENDNENKVKHRDNRKKDDSENTKKESFSKDNKSKKKAKED